MEDLTDTVAVVTGASSGIGRATARELLAAGVRVVIGARRRDRLEVIEAEYPGQAVAVAMDVRSPEECRRLVGTAIERFGRIDSLIANAGIGMYGGILDQTDEALATMLETNVAGTVWPIRAAVPHMVEAGRGDIVIVASVAGFRAGADEAVYAATEFAIGSGRTDDMPELHTYLRAEDIAFAIRTVLEQPRRLRTQFWSIWSMAQES